MVEEVDLECKRRATNELLRTDGAGGLWKITARWANVAVARKFHLWAKATLASASSERIERMEKSGKLRTMVRIAEGWSGRRVKRAWKTWEESLVQMKALSAKRESQLKLVEKILRGAGKIHLTRGWRTWAGVVKEIGGRKRAVRMLERAARRMVARELNRGWAGWLSGVGWQRERTSKVVSDRHRLKGVVGGWLKRLLRTSWEAWRRQDRTKMLKSLVANKLVGFMVTSRVYRVMMAFRKWYRNEVVVGGREMRVKRRFDIGVKRAVEIKHNTRLRLGWTGWREKVGMWKGAEKVGKVVVRWAKCRVRVAFGLWRVVMLRKAVVNLNVARGEQ